MYDGSNKLPKECQNLSSKKLVRWYEPKCKQKLADFCI